MSEIASNDGKPVDGEIFDEVFQPYALESSVNEAVEAMDWLKRSDRAVVELCRQYARRIDLALRMADLHPDNAHLAVSAVKALYTGPHLLNALKNLGGTPGDRIDLEIKRSPSKTQGAPAQEKESDPVADFLKTNLATAKERARKAADS